MTKRPTASCGLCTITVTAATEQEAVEALFAHLKAAHPDAIGEAAIRRAMADLDGPTVYEQIKEERS